MEASRNVILLLIINSLAILCYLLGKENHKRKKGKHEKK